MTHMPAALVTDGIEIPDPTLIVSWPAAAVAVVLIFGLLMWPGLLAWLNSRRTREAAEDTRHQVHPNSGKSLRDQTNRIESGSEYHPFFPDHSSIRPARHTESNPSHEQVTDKVNGSRPPWHHRRTATGHLRSA